MTSKPKGLGVKTKYGSIGITGRKKGVGLKGRAKLLKMELGGHFGVHKKGGDLEKTIKLGRARALVGGKMKFKNGLKTSAKGKLGISKKPIVTTNVDSGITKNKTYASGKFNVLGLGGLSAQGGVKYGKGLPSVGGKTHVTFGGQKLGGGFELGGPKIIDAELTLPFVGKVFNIVNNKPKRSTRSTKRSTRGTKRSTRRTKRSTRRS